MSKRNRLGRLERQERKRARDGSRSPQQPASYARRDNYAPHRHARRSSTPPRSRRHERRSDSATMLSSYRPTYEDDPQPALLSLLSQIDYTKLDREPPRLSDDSYQSRHDALADALDYMDHLKGKPALDSRKKSHYFVCKDLRYEVPERFLVDAAAQKQLLQSRNLVPSPIIIALAAVGWIKELKAKTEKAEEVKGRSMRTKGEDQEDGELVSLLENGVGRNAGRELFADAVAVKPESEQLVVNFFRKMERWIRRWESGEIKGDGWNTMKDCMEFSD